MDNNPTNNPTGSVETPTVNPIPSTQETPTVNQDTVMGILCYLGPLVLVPFLTKKEDPFVAFHVKQGLVLFALEVILGLISSYLYMGYNYGIYGLISVIRIGFLILSIVGIYHVINKKEAPLPLIGQWSSVIKF